MDEKKLQKLKAKYSKVIAAAGLSHKWREAVELLYSDPAKGEFSSWMLAQLTAGFSINDIIPTVQYYHQNRKLFSHNKIQEYRDIKELEDEVKGIEEQKDKKRQEITVEDSERTPIWSNDKFFLVRINSKKASQKYGKGTKWCITMSGASFYEQYKAHNIIFYFLLPREGDDKYAFSVARDMDNKVVQVKIFNAEDKVVPSAPYYEEYKSTMLADANAQPENVLPKLTKGTASKEEFLEFIEIYHKDYEAAVKAGDKEVINNAKKAIKQLSVYLGLYPKSLMFIAKHKHPEMIGAIDIDTAPPGVLLQLAKSTDVQIKMDMADVDFSAPPEVLLQLAKDTDKYVRQRVARHPSTPPEVLLQLAKDTNLSVRGYVAQHPSAPPEALLQLAKDANEFVVKDAAQHPSLPLEALLQLAKHTNLFIRFCAIRNPSMPPEELLQLANDTDVYVKRNVAQNPALPLEGFLQLAKDTDREVKRFLASNPSVPPEVSSQLLKDGIYDTPPRHHYPPNIDQKPEASPVSKPVPQTEQYYASLPISQTLSNDLFENKEIAESPQITNNMVQELLKLENPKINKALLGNPSVPDDIKQKIKQEQYSEKYDYLAASQNHTMIKESVLDIQLLRHAALELQGNSQDIVKVAGIIKRIKNWWKARFNPEFAKQTAIVEEAIGDTKGPLSQLISELKEFDTAIQNHDPDTVAQLVGRIPGTIAQVTKDMATLQQKLKAADMVIPTTYVDQEGNEIAPENLSWVQKGYKKDRALMEKLWEALPEKFRDEIPIGKTINKPLSSFGWYQDYRPEDISISQTVYANLKVALLQGTKSLKINKHILRGFDDFINNLKTTIIEKGILANVRFPKVSEQVRHRPSNQMVLDVRVGNVPFPIGDAEIFFNIPKVTLNDLGTGVYPTKKLTLYAAYRPTLSPESELVLEQIRMQSSLPPPDFEQVRVDEAVPIDTGIETEAGMITGMVKFALDLVAFSVSQEMADICKDLRELGDQELLQKGMCVYAAMTDVDTPNVDLSYSYLMRKLRKGDDEKRIKFQKAFKEGFDKALYEDVDDPAAVALMVAIKEIENSKSS